MEDMFKSRYLVGKAGAQKLKRKIPVYLRPLADKTAFVKSVRNLSTKAIRQKANLFAASTDAELAKLQSVFELSQAPKPLAGTAPALSKVRAEQIVFCFREKRLRAMVESNSLLVDPSKEDNQATIADAADDYTAAISAATEGPCRTDLLALELLVDNGLLTPSQKTELLVDGWPSDLDANAEFQYLCRLLEHEQVTLARLRFDSLLTGNVPSLSEALARTQLSHTVSENPKVKGTKTVRELIEFFQAHKRNDVTRSRQAQYTIPLRALEEQFGLEMHLDDIGREKCRKLMEVLARIPAYVTQRYRGLSLLDAISTYEKAGGNHADRLGEANKHVQVLKSVFQLAVDEGWITTNPWIGLELKLPREKRKHHETKESGYKSFDGSQLHLIFGAPPFMDWGTKKWGSRPDHCYWAPIIALFSGLRMNEILQLEKADLAEERGIAYFAVTDEEHGSYGGEAFVKRLKTANSVRDVPVHPVLVALGFLQWVQAQNDGRLFPGAIIGAGEKPSDLYSKRFAYFLKKIGIWERRRYVFHSFRHTFTDALRDAGVPEEIRKAIEGWQNQRDMDARYGRGHKIETLYGALRKVNYPSVKMFSLVP